MSSQVEPLLFNYSLCGRLNSGFGVVGVTSSAEDTREVA